MAIKGLKQVLKNLDKFGKEAKKEIDIVTFATAKDIELDAKNLAPVDLGKLRQNILVEKVEESDYKVVSLMKYSAFVEFGTGKNVSVPDELRELAVLFKGKGVKEIHIQPQPFLYPAFVKGRENYLKDLEALLEDLSKKYE